jgi:hypothetical protein
MKDRLEKIGNGIGIILMMWMIISAGMIEIAGSAGILWGAVITFVIILCIYIYYRPESFF